MPAAQFTEPICELRSRHGGSGNHFFFFLITEQTSLFQIPQYLREKPSMKPAGGEVSQIRLSQRNKAGGYKWTRIKKLLFCYYQPPV